MGEIQYAYPLIHNKVTSPHYVTATLRRGRLLDWLDERQECRALVIAAGAGYGKTTLLWQWEREANFPCYWYKLDRNDRDWSLHISYLIEAVAQRHPGFGKRAHSMLLQLGGPGSSRPGVAAFLLSEMHDRLTEPCTFIIDDWHFVSSVTEVRGLWNQILRDAPPTCRFVFASRAKPQLQFARLKTHAGYGELRTDDLRLTDTEIDELFRDVYRDPLSSEELAELERRTEGWAASLQLVEVSLRERQTPEERQKFIESITATSDSDLFSFLAEEVLDQQTEETQNFLLSTSILQQITPDLAERLAGVHDGVRRLLELEHAGLFTHRVDERQYRYHGLFREFLERRLIAERSEAEVLGLHIHAASYFETTARWPEAIHHYLQAGLQRQAARLIARYGEDVVAEGRLGLVDEWLTQLPPRTTRDNARLGLLYGETLSMRGEWVTALDALERSKAFFRRKGDRRMEALACLKLSSMYHARGEPEIAADLARQGLEIVPTEARVIRLRLDGDLAITHTWVHDSIEAAARICQRVTAEAQASDLGHFAAIGLHNLGVFQREMGHLPESRTLLERAWKFWQAASPSPFAENAELVTTLLALDQLDQARRFADFGVARTKSWPRPHLEALAGQASVAIYEGRFAEAADALGSRLAGADDFGVSTEHAYQLLIEALVLGPGPAPNLREAYDRLAARVGDPRLAAATQTALATGLHALGCQGDCLTSAASAIERARERGALFTLVGCNLKLGILGLAHGSDLVGQRGFQALAEVRQMGTLRYYRHWVRLYRPYLPSFVARADAGQLLAGILAADAEFWRTPLVDLLPSLHGEGRSTVLSALVHRANREVVDRLGGVAGRDVADVRRLLIQRQATRLFVRSFGTMALHRAGWNGPTVGLSRRRLKSMLAILLAFHGQTLTREVVLEALWPDADPSAAINSLNQGLFQLRRTLDPRYRDGESPTYVVSDRESVGLSTDLVHTDLQEFRRATAKLRDGAPEELARAAVAAVELVRGPFLADTRYDDWAFAASEAIHSEIREPLLAIAQGTLLPRHHELGVRAATALLTIDAYDEAAQVALARRLAAAGRRAAARAAILQFYRRMQAEFDDAISDELVAAVRELGASAQVYPHLTPPSSDHHGA